MYERTKHQIVAHMPNLVIVWFKASLIQCYSWIPGRKSEQISEKQSMWGQYQSYYQEKYPWYVA